MVALGQELDLGAGLELRDLGALAAALRLLGRARVDVGRLCGPGAALTRSLAPSLLLPGGGESVSHVGGTTRTPATHASAGSRLL